MCLINVAHEHLITQIGKKSIPALINFMGPGAKGRGPTYGAEGQEKQIPVFFISLIGSRYFEQKVIEKKYSRN